MSPSGGFRYSVVHQLPAFPETIEGTVWQTWSRCTSTGDGVACHLWLFGPRSAKEGTPVPELACPLFSVRAALAKGMAVHFSPPAQSGSPDRVEVQHGGPVTFTASAHSELYFLDELVSAAASGALHDVELARQWHRRLGHLGYSTLAGLTCRGLLSGWSTSPAAFMQVSKQQIFQPCMEGKLRRESHPTRHPRLVRVLHRLHMDLCELRPGLYFATVVDEATRYGCVDLLHHKSDTAAKGSQAAYLVRNADGSPSAARVA
jgi:hypothetical protein